MDQTLSARKPDPAAFSGIAADVLARIRERTPRVHCLTNAVAQNFTANVLLAAGAIPSMTVAPEEIAEFVARADALLINLGTLDRDRRTAAEVAIEEAAAESVPWVLDPVFVDRSHPRTAFAKSLAAQKPAAVRLNGAEFAALAGREPSTETVQQFAREHECVVALTGADDLIGDGARLATVKNGDALMGRVTAMGCAGAAILAAALAVEDDAWLATTAALVAFGVAGEVAAARAKGPGSFAVEIVDALASLDAATLRAKARVG
jgi:hydroxyethylthiazole kinase